MKHRDARLHSILPVGVPGSCDAREMGPSPCFSEYKTAGTEAVVLTPGHSDDDARNHEELRKQGWVCVLQA